MRDTWRAPSEADFFADAYSAPAAGRVQNASYDPAAPSAVPSSSHARRGSNPSPDEFADLSPTGVNTSSSFGNPIATSDVASRGLHSEYHTTTMQVRHSSDSASRKRKGFAPLMVVLAAAVTIGSVAAVTGAAASDNTAGHVISQVSKTDTPGIDAPELAGWAVAEAAQSSRLAYDPSASDLFALVNTAAVLQDSRELAAEALAVQAEMDAIEEARQEAIRRATAIASAAEVYSESMMMGQLSSVEATQLAADMGLQPGDFIVPTDDASVTSPYGWRPEPLYGYNSFHAAMDLGANCGQEIYASADGVVSYAGWYGQLGYWVKISHGDLSTGYGHMSWMNVEEGQEVKQGDLIGWVGDTGYSFGCHIHWQAFAGDTDKTFDPAVLIAAGQP
jgi:murein DD-endopeptidase MepM/ murein hydrolase activator NlpD